MSHSPENADEQLDPGGLIREAYRIEGLNIEQARSIFLDWSIKTDVNMNMLAAIHRLLGLYNRDENHPMTEVLRQGLQAMETQQGRRGGSRARRGVTDF